MGLLPQVPTEDCGSVTESVGSSRAREWVLAHQGRNEDGTWGVNPNRPETVRVVDQVVSTLIQSCMHAYSFARISNNVLTVSWYIFVDGIH